MRADDFGPVAVSRLKTESDAIFGALNAGRRVLIAHRGEVLYAIDPSPDLPAPVLAMYSLPQFDTTPFEVTATILNQGMPSPAQWLKRVRAGEPALVTRSGKLFGAVRTVSKDELANEVVSQHDRDDEARIDKFLADNPKATAADLADFTSELETASDVHLPYLEELLGPDVRRAQTRRRRVKAAYLTAFKENDQSIREPLRRVATRALN